MRVELPERFKDIIKSLEDTLKGYSTDSKRSARIIVETEVAALVMMDILPPPHTTDQLAYVYSGTYIRDYNAFGPEERRLWTKGKVLLPGWKAKRIVRQRLDSYQALDVPQAALHLRFEEQEVTWETLSQYDDRKDAYLAFLREPLPMKENNKSYASFGHRVKYYDQHLQDYLFVIVPEYLETSSDRLKRRPACEKEAIRVNRQDLLDTAKEMDRLSDRSWEKRMARMVFNRFSENQLRATDQLVIEGTGHWAGTLASGKSTWMYVMACHQAKQGKRTVLIVGDVTAALDMIDQFYDLNVHAVPMLSFRRRKEHIRQYFTSIHEPVKHLGRLKRRRALRYLGDTCILQALEKQDTGDEPPCLRLYEQKKRKVCPYLPACPYHHALHDLDDAEVIVTTIQGLVNIELPSVMTGEILSLLEYVSRETDLIMVDESDRVQGQLDSMFAPEEQIAGQQDSLLDRLLIEARQSFYQSKMPLSNPLVQTWLNALSNAVTASDHVFGQLQNEPIRQMAGNQYFTGLKLMKQVLYRCYPQHAGKDEPEINDPSFTSVSDLMNRFVRRYRDAPFSEIPGHDEAADFMERLRRIANTVTQNNDQLAAELALAVAYLSKVTTGKPKEVSGQLRFALIVLFLERNLADVLHYSHAIKEELRVPGGRQAMPLLNRAVHHLQGIIPVSPTGIWMGFSYKTDKNRLGASGSLHFFQYLGVGRYVLTDMHRLFEDLDHVQGPPTVLLSGTSFAPDSSMYHLQIPVTYVLENAVEPRPAVEIRFQPLAHEGGFVRISGKVDSARQLEIKRAVRSLVKQKVLKRALDTSDDGRERVLIITGSYVESEIVGAQLRELWPSPHEVYHLVRNDDIQGEEGEWSRSKITAFAESRGKCLVVPLMAMERAHNVLMTRGDQSFAAFQTAVFLIRPYPVPYDVKRVVSRLNEMAISEKNQDPGDPRWDIKSDTLAIRKRAYAIQQELLTNQTGFSYLSDEERRRLAMDMFISSWQLIGRMIRGGVPARVILCDGGFAPETVKGGRDSVRSSMVISWRDLMNGLAENGASAALSEKLYGVITASLQNVEGIDDETEAEN